MNPKDIFKIELGRRVMMEGMSTVEDFLKSKLIYSVNLHTLKYRIRLSLSRFFDTELAVTTEEKNDGDFDICIGYDTYNTNNHHQSPSITVYKGTVIVLTQTFGREKTYNNDCVSFTPSKDLYLSTLKTKKDIHNLKEFIKKLVILGDKINTSYYKKKTQLANNENSGYPMSLPRRTFNDVFIKDDDKRKIIDSVDKFVASKDWYVKHNIPYHFGIILYGLPGSGKTSIAQAIANHLDANMTIIQGDDMLELPKYIRNGEIPRNPEYTHVILVEDCDCGMKDLRNAFSFRSPESFEECSAKQDKRPLGMANLLNALDGVGAPSNTIYIFTTNHIEKLDSALIRPGRIDLKLDIGGVCQETLDQFMMEHFGVVKELSAPLNIPEDLTFAELQIEVMKGCTYEQIIKYIREK
jgi:hypothetical protein